MNKATIENLYWIAKARKGEASGFIGKEASAEILKGILAQEKCEAGTCGKMKEKES
jgi:hypothetical protein